jgi:hypothetical protein
MIEPPFLRRVRVKNPHKLKPTPVIMSAVITKLLEPSTIRGLISIIGAFGIAIHPDMVPHIVTAVMAINGLINVWRKETQAPKPEIVP